MTQASDLERQMLELINAERAAAGLDPVELELRLNTSAEDHSLWMLNTDTFSHTGQGGSSAGDRMEDAGFQFTGSWTWAENIAWQSVRGAPGYEDDVIDLHNGLMNSSGHRANILNANVEVIGIGIEIGNFDGWDAIIVTQNFARTSAPLELDVVADGGMVVAAGSRGTTGDDWLILEDGAIGRLTGLAGNDMLEGSDARNILIGGAGDDDLSGNGGNDRIIAGVGDDIGVGGAGADIMLGGAGNDDLDGGTGDDTLNGGAGSNVLTGGDGEDSFVFARGTHAVTDFETGDLVDLGLSARISDYADLVANHMTQAGADVVIDDGRGSLMILQDTQLSDLSADDFAF